MITSYLSKIKWYVFTKVKTIHPLLIVSVCLIFLIIIFFIGKNIYLPHTSTFFSKSNVGIVSVPPSLPTTTPVVHPQTPIPSSTQITTTPPPTNLWLKTTSSKPYQIIDAFGAQFVMHGVNSSGMEYGRGESGWLFPLPDNNNSFIQPVQNPLHQNIYDEIANNKFNTVRIPFAWDHIEPTMPENFIPIKPGEEASNDIGPTSENIIHNFAKGEAYLTQLEYIVNEYGKRGIRVILDAHQVDWSPAFSKRDSGFYPQENSTKQCQPGRGMPVWLYSNPCGGNIDPSDVSICTSAHSAKVAFFKNKHNSQKLFADMWEHVAQRFATNPYVVGYDLINEPNFVQKQPCNDTTNPATYTSPQTQLPIYSNDFYTTLAQKILKVHASIQGANPHPLLILELYNGSDTPALGSPRVTFPNFPNAVISVHFYPGYRLNENKITYLTWLLPHIANVYKSPVLLGEFTQLGFAKESLQQWDGGKDMKILFDILQGNYLSKSTESKKIKDSFGKIGWIYWSGTNGITWALFPHDGKGKITPNTDMINFLRLNAMY